MNREAARLAAAMTVSERAARRLRKSLSEDRALIEQAIVTPEAALTREMLLVLDAFVQRFQQVHEHMVHRLYPAIYRAEELGDRPPAMLTLLRWLRELGLVEDIKAWGRYAEARNRLVHEYPLEERDRAEALNAALGYSVTMLSDLERAIDHATRKGLADAE